MSFNFKFKFNLFKVLFKFLAGFAILKVFDFLVESNIFQFQFVYYLLLGNYLLIFFKKVKFGSGSVDKFFPKFSWPLPRSVAHKLVGLLFVLLTSKSLVVS